MKRNLIALLLALLLALTLPLTALGEGEGAEPTYIKLDENLPFDIVTRAVYQIGDVTAPEEFVLSGEVDGITESLWLEQEGYNF